MPPRKKDPTKMRKNLDVNINTAKKIAKKAIDKGTNFKNLSEQVLDDYANNKLINKLQSASLTKCAEEALKK